MENSANYRKLILFKQKDLSIPYSLLVVLVFLNFANSSSKDESDNEKSDMFF